MASLPLPVWPAEQATLAPPPAPPKLVPLEKVSPQVQRQARLSALEWSVVALAERDTIASLREPGRLAAAFEGLFGFTRPNKLAHPRLEALRRVSVFAWRKRWQVPASELKAFLAQGFTLDQYELIQASIASSHAKARQRRQGR